MAPITICRDAFVFAEAFIGMGVIVGERAVVAARTVVVRNVPAEDIVAGNPARVIGTRSENNRAADIPGTHDHG
jgi:putative colanic acid biosynthesis acetyltransferase WcaF